MPAVLSRLSLGSLVLTFACALGLAHCQSPTAVMVRLTTDVPCDQLRGVTFTVGKLGEVEAKPSTTTASECTGTELGSLAVVPSGDKDEELTIKVIGGVKRDAESCEAPGYGTGCIVARRTIRYREHTTLPMVIALRSACNGVICADDQTCVSGGCTSAKVDANLCSSGACDDAVLTPSGLPKPLPPSPLVCGDSGGLQAASPWPMLGGCPTHIGRSAFVGAQSNRVAWKAPLGDAATTGIAIAADGTIYAGAADGKLYAVDPRGAVKWSTALGSTFSETVPAIGRDGTVYVGNDDQNLRAISPAGAVSWQFPIGGTIFTSPSIGGDGTLYVGGGRGQASMFALTPVGAQRWRFDSGAEMDSAPAVGQNGTVYTASEDQNLYALNADGTKKWTFAVGEPAQTPVVGLDGTIYFAGKNSVCAVDDRGKFRWVSQTKSDATTPAIAADGTVYSIERAGTLYAFDGVTGSPKWGIPLGEVPWGMQPVIGGDGTIYVGSTNNTFYAVTPGGTIKWQLVTGGPITGPAAIGRDGTVYFGSGDRNLYAVGP